MKKESIFTDLVKNRLGDITSELVFQTAEKGDSLCKWIVEETARYLGIGIANLINAFNPELIIFGGVVSLASSYLLPAIEKAIKERSLIWPRQMARVTASSHGPEACVMGGVALVLHDILNKPALIA